jgi:catalase
MSEKKLPLTDRVDQFLRRVLHAPTGTRLTLPVAAIGGAVCLLGAAYAGAAGWLSPQRVTPALIIQRFTDNAGVHPGYRRNHAKGICVVGYFDGNGSAGKYSRASVFADARTPVVGRLAIPGGNPTVPDASSPTRSMALLFLLPHGEQWRTAMNNSPVFIVNSVQGFNDLLAASKPDPATKKPDPAVQKAFFDRHPESSAAREWGKTHAASSAFANGAYYSVNAFRLVDAAGHAQFARWSFEPEQAYIPVSKDQGADPNFLEDELVRQLQVAPLRWHLRLTLAQPGDVTDDATRAWPADRATITAGTLTLTTAMMQENGPCRDVNFDPLILPAGIEPSADPLLAARSAAYARSFRLRTSEEAHAGNVSSLSKEKK